MANEISITASIAVNKGGATIAASGSKTEDMAGDQMISNVQIATTSWAAVAFGSVSTVGPVLFKNLDSTNFIELSLDNSGTNKFAKIRAGEPNLISLQSTTVYIKADTASVNVFIAGTEI